MHRLDEIPEIEKTSIFGTSVHAILRTRDISPAMIAARLRDAGIEAEINVVEPSLEDVFLDVVERSAA
jgi:hypothetical protein